ncbi:hypothetical protein BGW36DRAFT_381314 [Talaromyces proteolyticus]|uniref:HIT-type domain-containing protein n=1 Tax=Talaromyces proteolyticus TaxID=1131652 RepID=A0AAD4Q070_9EURO|nr:uncharacterized protein BGW36DRAFT_381314 [Talaromyces proteolyticus]KAH8696608.1 hypothetical protein BGW36DRAFT_381314 [Talaromyces proteolyticus]
MSSTGPLLSDLCAIWSPHLPPKYRCPRCLVRTCSLPCTRKHKKWSQCTGQRDPAAYLARPQLATPDALDRDFNFITGIERSLERAEREAERRGIELEHEYMLAQDGKRKRSNNNNNNNKGGRLVKGEAAFLKAVQMAGVKLVRAPRGLSRRKDNASRVHQKHKCLNWTVEWISATKERVLQNCLETTPLDQAYTRVFPAVKEEGERYFYLHRQSTPTPRQVVLVPLERESTLSDVLRGRTVLEFPTVYVLDKPAQRIDEEEGFVLEEVYLRENPDLKSEDEVDVEEVDYTSSEGSSMSSTSDEDSEDGKDSAGDEGSEDEDEGESRVTVQTDE